MTYEESVRSPRWFVWSLAASGAFVLLAGLWVLIDAESRAGGGAVAGAVLCVSGLLLGLVARTFGTLRVAVDADALRVRFGRWGPTVPREDIATARVERYRWLAYGGWGVRLGRQGGRWSRAYSAPFVRSGVQIDTREGRRYYVTSRRPAELARALTGPATGAHTQ